MKHLILIISTITLLFSVSSCQKQANSAPIRPKPIATDSEFNNYWYAGKAEVSSYDLSQSRYGEIHEGEAVLVFVTEPFSASKQVKLDYPEQSGTDNVSIMKMNFTKKFNTGIYPYSMMLSTFTPIDTYHNPNTLKATASVQEWCGQVFAQMNLSNDNYDILSYSYFESEGDKQQKIKRTILEDEIWNRIRMDYRNLPIGEVTITPGLFYTRLRHKEMKPQKAKATLQEGAAENVYSLEFPDHKRKLSITFDANFPYQITSWEETYQGMRGKDLTTKARLKKSLHIPYWSKNRLQHSALRDSLQLSF